jgi:hypothetical protein
MTKTIRYPDLKFHDRSIRKTVRYVGKSESRQGAVAIVAIDSVASIAKVPRQQLLALRSWWLDMTIFIAQDKDKVALNGAS